MDNSLKGYYKYRDNTINAIIAYYSMAEGRIARRAKTPAKEDPDPKYHYLTLNDDPIEAAVLSVFINSGMERPRRYFICVGAALSLETDDPRSNELIHKFYTSGDLSKHFRRRHFSYISDASHNTSLRCAVCDMSLTGKMHLRNHALRVHGTVS